MEAGSLSLQELCNPYICSDFPAENLAKPSPGLVIGVYHLEKHTIRCEEFIHIAVFIRD